MPLLEQHHVAQGPHGAEAAALGQKAHDQPHADGEYKGCMLRAGAFDGIEEHAALRLFCHLRIEQIQGHEGKHDAGQHQAGNLALALAAAQRKAHAEKYGANAHAADQARKTKERKGVAARKAQNNAPGATQKDQRANTRYAPQQKAGDGGRAAARLVFAKGQRRAKCAKHHAHDFGPQILHDGRAVKAQRASDIAVKADHADAHVAGIAHLLEQHGKHAEHKPGGNDACCGGEKIEAWFHEILLLGPQARGEADV